MWEKCDRTKGGELSVVNEGKLSRACPFRFLPTFGVKCAACLWAQGGHLSQRSKDLYRGEVRESV